MSKKNGKNGNGQPLNIRPIKPLTRNQERTFDAFDTKNLLLHGSAGTGKSFIALYLALRELYQHDTAFHKLYVIRSAVPARDIGFMPGTLEEKIEVYEAPYKAMCCELIGRYDAYDTLKKLGLIEFISTSFIRGRTLEDCIILVDEIQNLDWGELSTIITRLGKNCKIVFCGDFRQSDFRGHEENAKKGVHDFMDVIKTMREDFATIEFTTDDIVRSPLVRNFLLATYQLGY